MGNNWFNGRALVVACWIPQIIKAYRTKSLKDLSYLWMIILLIATFLWLSYGFHLLDIPLIFTNIGAGSLLLLLFFMKIYYDKKRKKRLKH